MRKPAKNYRDWSVKKWCEHVRRLGAGSLTQWALASRSSYNHAVALGLQRDVARALGWLPPLAEGEMASMSDDEFALRFRSKGVRSIPDMWRGNCHWCKFLRHEGRLESVANLLGIGYVIERHPPELEYYLKRCELAGDLNVWRQLDKNAAAAARKYGLMAEIERRAPKRPPEGYPSSGGPCRSLAELAVARELEAAGVGFVTQLYYPFTFPRGKRRPCETDFYLTHIGAYVEVWSVPLDDTSRYWERSRVQRLFKTDMCRKLNLHLLEIESQILFRQGPEAFLRHARIVLADAGIELSESPLDRWAALDPQYVPQVGGDGG